MGIDRNEEMPFDSFSRQERFPYNHGMSKDMSSPQDYQERYYQDVPRNSMFSNQESLQHDSYIYNQDMYQDGPSDRMYETQHEAYPQFGNTINESRIDNSKRMNFHSDY